MLKFKALQQVTSGHTGQAQTFTVPASHRTSAGEKRHIYYLEHNLLKLHRDRLNICVSVERIRNESLEK